MAVYILKETIKPSDREDRDYEAKIFFYGSGKWREDTFYFNKSVIEGARSMKKFGYDTYYIKGRRM